MTQDRGSILKRLLSALLSSLVWALFYSFLYFLLYSVSYRVFHEQLQFANFHQYDWMESALGTIAMFLLAFIVEFARKMMGNRG